MSVVLVVLVSIRVKLMGRNPTLFTFLFCCYGSCWIGVNANSRIALLLDNKMIASCYQYHDPELY